MSGRIKDFRMDLVFRVIDVDEENKRVKFVMKPHPRRYEWKKIEGKRFLYDKLDNVYFPEDV